MHLVSNKASQNVLMATYFAMTDQRLNVYHSCGKKKVSGNYLSGGKGAGGSFRGDPPLEFKRSLFSRAVTRTERGT